MSRVLHGSQGPVPFLPLPQCSPNPHQRPLSCHLVPLVLSACSKGLKAGWAQLTEQEKVEGCLENSGPAGLSLAQGLLLPKSFACPWRWDKGLPVSSLHPPFTTQVAVGMLCLLGPLCMGKGLEYIYIIGCMKEKMILTPVKTLTKENFIQGYCDRCQDYQNSRERLGCGHSKDS